MARLVESGEAGPCEGSEVRDTEEEGKECIANDLSLGCRIQERQVR